MHPPVASDTNALLDERALSKLHWRCRRGLLENDLFIDSFFQRYETVLTIGHAQGMAILMDLSDNDLLDLLLRRKEPSGTSAQPPAFEVLQMLREAGAQRHLSPGSTTPRFPL